MAGEIMKYKTDHGDVTLSPDIIRTQLVSGGGQVSDAEVMMFLNLCKYQGLNPFLRDAYLIKYGGNAPASMVVGKDTFMKRANKNKNFLGFEAGIIIVDRKGAMSPRKGTIVLAGETLVGGWARVHVKGYEKPVEISVSLEEYMGRKNDGSVTKQWLKMPATMIRKVAIVQALREAFPSDFQGLYDEAEMGGKADIPEHNANSSPAKTYESGSFVSSGSDSGFSGSDPDGGFSEGSHDSDGVAAPSLSSSPPPRYGDVRRQQIIGDFADTIEKYRKVLTEEKIAEIRTTIRSTKDTDTLEKIFQNFKDETNTIIVASVFGVPKNAVDVISKPALLRETGISTESAGDESFTEQEDGLF